jgi:hypothetical protein
MAKVIDRAATDKELVGSVAYECLTWLGVLAGGWQWAISASDALARGDRGETPGIIETAAFYGKRVLPRVRMHEAAVRSGSAPVTAVPQSDL